MKKKDWKNCYKEQSEKKKETKTKQNKPVE